MAKPPARPCGKHNTLHDNRGARVSQCPCGAVHLMIKSSGVTLQLSEDRFREMGLAVMGAIASMGEGPSVSGGTTRIIN